MSLNPLWKWVDYAWYFLIYFQCGKIHVHVHVHVQCMFTMFSVVPQSVEICLNLIVPLQYILIAHWLFTWIYMYMYVIYHCTHVLHKDLCKMGDLFANTWLAAFLQHMKDYFVSMDTCMYLRKSFIQQMALLTTLNQVRIWSLRVAACEHPTHKAKYICGLWIQ